MGELVSIVYKPKEATANEDGYTRLPLQEAHLVVGRGIEGDLKGASKTRQLNIMASNTVTELATEGFSASPGEMGEQLLVADVEINSLAPGTQIRIGASACIEVTEPRTGCGKFERYQGKRKEEASGRLGQMAVVVADGIIRIGDSVQILPVTEAS